MPIVSVEPMLRPEDVVEFFADFIKKSNLPFEYVAKYNENLLPQYPAIQIMSGGFQKELHATHTFLLTLRADIYVMHAKLTESRATRSLNDLKLATQTVELIEKDLTLGGRCIAGWVETERPGAIPPRTAKGEAVISTLLMWRGTQEGRF
jgi:hypothetical protein